MDGAIRERRGAELPVRRYDFIVCGSGSSGSVIARRLAENPAVSVLLIEAGGSDDHPEVFDPGQWTANLGSGRNWNFQAEPSPAVNGRVVPMDMGKVLGGGSSINAMTWARGHASDWDFYAAETGDEGWRHAAVLDVYKSIEDWHGTPDPAYRGTGGPMFVAPAATPHPLVAALLDGARSVGIPTFDSPNGRMMDGQGGAASRDMIIRDGRRQSVFRSYVAPMLGRPNLTVLTETLVTRVTFSGRRATGVEIVADGKLHRVEAGREVILSLGAIHTPKILMQSGIGDETELRRFGIPIVEHLPGVGRNLQDHAAFSCVWEAGDVPLPHDNPASATVYWRSAAGLTIPDMFICQLGVPFASAESRVAFGMPTAGWTLHGAVARPRSRGRVCLTGPGPLDPVRIEANLLSHPDDMAIAVACVELCRAIGNSVPLRPFVGREVMPGDRKRAALEHFIRNDAMSYYHETCTAKMGRDAMAVVDGKLAVHGLDGLRIADGSVLPRVTTGNTMAPCVVIGERAAEIVRARHGC